MQKKNYFISSADARKCEEKDLTEKIRSPWEWLDKAEAVGNLTRNGVLFDLWQYKTAGTHPASLVTAAGNVKLTWDRASSCRRHPRGWRAPEEPHRAGLLQPQVRA